MNKFMGNFSLFMIMMSAFVGVFANDIYITQSGVTLDLAVTQDGDNNVMGTSGARVIVTGANATWTVSQVGDSNIISATILGATYTGTWAVTGSANDIAFLCSSATDITATVTGNHNTVDIDMDGAQGASTTTVVTLNNSGAGTATATDNNIDFDYLKSGDGDSVGHKLNYVHTGSGEVDIIQTGTNDNIIDAIITSTGADVDITQTD